MNTNIGIQNDPGCCGGDTECCENITDWGCCLIQGLITPLMKYPS